jgi:lipopolysaccharide assembly outer membrane protein LptD (OstA)
MKKIILLSSIILSTSAFAISDDALSKACLETGKQKLQQSAIKKFCLLESSTVYASNVDNSIFNATKGITYTGTMNCLISGDKIISQAVQYYKGNCK